MRDKWVTFDCFGTLMDWQAGFRRALQPVVGSRADALVDAYHHQEASVEAEAPSRSYREVLRLTLLRAAAKIGVDLSPAAADCLALAWADMPAFADTAPALQALRADGWKLGVLTNCDDDLFAQTAARFPVPLDCVVTAQQVQSYKPGLAHFSTFEQRTGIGRDRWVHAAVSWFHDMVPAKTLGIRRVWVDRERTGQDASIATAYLHDLAALPATVRGFAVA